MKPVPIDTALQSTFNYLFDTA